MWSRAGRSRVTKPGLQDAHLVAYRKWFVDSETGVTGVKVLTAVGEMTFLRNFHTEIMHGVYQYSWPFPHFRKLVIDFST